jgi:hypothetical protein
MFNKFFLRKSCRLRDNVEKYGIARQAIDDSKMRRVRVACLISKTIDTQSAYVILLDLRGIHGYAEDGKSNCAAGWCVWWTGSSRLFLRQVSIESRGTEPNKQQLSSVSSASFGRVTWYGAEQTAIVVCFFGNFPSGHVVHS